MEQNGNNIMMQTHGVGELLTKAIQPCTGRGENWSQPGNFPSLSSLSAENLPLQQLFSRNSYLAIDRDASVSNMLHLADSHYQPERTYILQDI